MEEEEKGVTLCSSEIVVIRGESEFCLVGGLITEKPVNKEAFRRTMAHMKQINLGGECSTKTYSVTPQKFN
jgi:hypothetical protein